MDRREFTFEEGASRKFWAVSVQDATMTVQYGKIGTAGQTQPKAFASPAAALAAAEKLIREKAGKGYVESGGAPKPAVAPAGPARVLRLPPEELDPPPIGPKAPLRPERPFDLASLRAKLEIHRNTYGDAIDAPAAVTPEEARFWLRACTDLQQAEKCVEPLSLDQFKAAFRYLMVAICANQLFKLQVAWVDPADLVELAADAPCFNCSGYSASQLSGWLRHEVWPRCDDAAMERVRRRLRTMLRSDPQKACFAAILARGAGVVPEVRAFVETLQKETLPGFLKHGEWHVLLLSLEDAAEILGHYRRLGLHVDSATAREFLARTRHDGLDVVARSIPHAGRAEEQLRMLNESLLLAESPEAAAALLWLKVNAKASRLVAKASAWLDKHPEHSVAGLEPLAKEKGKLGEAARDWLDAHRKRTAAPAAPIPAAPIPAAPAAPERRLNLAPEDWQRAGPPEPASPPSAPRPFDLEACKALALAYLGRNDMPFDPDVPVTPQEARFWLCHNSTTHYCHGDAERAQAVGRHAARQFDAPWDLGQVKHAVAKMLYWSCNQPTLRLQRWALGPADLVEALASDPMFEYCLADAAATARWLAAQVFPRLDVGAMESVRERLRSLIGGTPPTWSLLTAATLARHAGMAADLAAWAAGIKKGGFPSKLAACGWGIALFGINDPARLVSEFRRLGLRLADPADAREWLARTGHDGLDILRDSILLARKAADQLALLDVLLLAESPEAAVALLEVKLQAKPPEAGARIDAWMKKHPGHAAAGLTPLTAESTPRGEAARALLGAGTSAPAPEGFAELLASVKPPKALPPFAAPALLPVVPGLDDAARLLGALKESTLAGPHPLVVALRRDIDRAALAAFAWALFQGWLDAGAPAKEKWALLSLGYFGDDGTVLKLAPLIRAWPGESQHQRAVTGLEILRAIGTDAALMSLNGMALKLKFKALQDRARGLMDLIAADRGLTREQLEDRIVPDLGLDADGGRVFDFGPRRFAFSLASDLAPAVSDESGKVLKDLPKPGMKDDPARAAEAVAAWKQLKAQLREALRIQVFRLEEAMVTGRGWSPAEFDSLLVRHPLMGHLARRLLWSGHDAEGATVRLFRIGEKGAATGHDGRPVSFEGVASVRVAHRLRMTPGQMGSWRPAFDDLDIVSPFPQLERTVFAPTAEEAGGRQFVRPAGPVPGAKIRGTLEERGWRRVMHDQGGITGFNKAFASAGVTGVVLVDPCLLIGMMDDSATRVERAFFVRGLSEPHGPCSDDAYGWGTEGRRLVLGEVDAVAFSEMARDLMSLAPPGKG